MSSGSLCTRGIFGHSVARLRCPPHGRPPIVVQPLSAGSAAATPRVARAASSPRRRAGYAQFWPPGRPRDRSSGLPSAAASGNAPVTRSSSRCPRTPWSGLFSSCAMPATNWPSAASFSDCVSRLRSSSRSSFELATAVSDRARRAPCRSAGARDRPES